MAVIRIPLQQTWTGRKYKLDLAALETGDKVATVSTTYGGPDAAIWTVTRLTPTQVVAECTAYGRTHEGRWRISDGKKMGESYGVQLLDPLDNEVLTAQQRKALAVYKDKVERVLKDQFSTRTGKSVANTAQDKLAALAEVAELTAEVAERIQALEAQRVTEEVPGGQA